MNLQQAHISRLIRRHGPQALLLTSAFATAMLLALAFRPARIATMEMPTSLRAAAPVKVPDAPEAEREAAQAKLAEAMARFTQTPTREPEAEAPAPAPATAPPPADAAQETLAAESTIEPTQPRQAPPAPPRLSESDLRRLNDKAAQAMRDGDIYGARLILEKAIEGGDAKALLILAETYDPGELARMNAKGVKPDADRARALYAQAIESGVFDARPKLNALKK